VLGQAYQRDKPTADGAHRWPVSAGLPPDAATMDTLDRLTCEVIGLAGESCAVSSLRS
jgi:hypothetical protein